MLIDPVKDAIAPALELLPHNLDTPQVRLLLLSIGLQESRFNARFQALNGGGKGPARGFWQFELGTKATKGGVFGVYLHSASHELLRLLCRDRDCNFDPAAIWSAVEGDDVLAAGVARLMLLTNPKPLPACGDEDCAWNYYLQTWRPGQPKRDSWPLLYAMAQATLSL